MAPVTLPPSLHRADPDYTRERYAPAQAALYLGKSTEFIYREVAAGRLSHRRDEAKRRRATGVRKTKGRISFSQADLDQWREARRYVGDIAVDNARSVVIDPLEADMPKVLRFA